MGSLFEELEAREAAARTRVEVLKAELAEVSGRLSAAWEGLDRLRIARETVAEVLAEMTPQKPGVAVDAGRPTAGEPVASAYAGAERQDAPGPVRAKQIVPRIGLPAETGKIEGTRSKLKRLVDRGWLDEDTPGMFAPARRRGGASPNSR
ncbi:hypothetical protein [Streptomyces mirabilis]